MDTRRASAALTAALGATVNAFLIGFLTLVCGILNQTSMAFSRESDRQYCTRDLQDDPEYGQEATVSRRGAPCEPWKIKKSVCN